MKKQTKWLLAGAGILGGYYLYRHITKKPPAEERLLLGAMPVLQTGGRQPGIPGPKGPRPLQETNDLSMLPLPRVPRMQSFQKGVPGVFLRAAEAVAKSVAAEAAKKVAGLDIPHMMAGLKGNILQNLAWLRMAAAKMMPDGVFYCDWPALAGSGELEILRDKMVFINADMQALAARTGGWSALSLADRAVYKTLLDAQAAAKAAFDAAIQQALACKAKWEAANPGKDVSQVEQEEGIILRCSISEGILGAFTGGTGTADVEIGSRGIRIVGTEVKAPFTGTYSSSGTLAVKK